MKKNMGISDRIVRLVIVTVIVTLYFAKVINGIPAIILIIAAIIFTLTSLTGFCPLYWPFKISTRKREDQAFKQ